MNELFSAINLRPLHGLVADIGATNARFALATLDQGDVSLRQALTLPCANYPNLAPALTDYFAKTGAERPDFAVFAVAGPVRGQAIRFTNNGWAFSARDISSAFGFKNTRLVNDFTANAVALPVLRTQDLAHLGGPKEPIANAQAVRAVCGPGSGFGVSALLGEGERAFPLHGEGGHVSFAPVDALEIEILQQFTRDYGRVSTERLLSGPGLCALDGFFAARLGAPRHLTAGEVTQAALEGDRIAGQALDKFFEILGSVAGDLALTFGAEAGMYIAGGIVPRLINAIQTSRFRTRFDDKGRLSYFVTAIPTYAILRGDLALVGCGAALRQVADSADAALTSALS